MNNHTLGLIAIGLMLLLAGNIGYIIGIVVWRRKLVKLLAEVEKGRRLNELLGIPETEDPTTPKP